MEDTQVVNQVVQKQATVGDIVNDHINGVGGYEIAEKYGIDPMKIQQIIQDADAAGKFIPVGSPVPIDKVTDTPVLAPAVEPLEEGENPEPQVVAEPQADAEVKMTTKNSI